MSWDESQNAAGPEDESHDLPPHTAPFTGGDMSAPYAAYPPAAPAKGNRGLLIGIAIGVVVVAAGGVAAFAASGHSSSPASSAAAATSATATAASVASALSATATSAAANSSSASATAALSLPSHADGLLLLTSGNAQQEVSRVRSGVDQGGSSVYAKALIGAYGPQANGGYRLVLVDQSLNNLSSAAKNQFLAYTPSDLVQTIANGAHMSGIQVENSSDASAAIVCGTIAYNSLSIPTCIWDDSQTFGLAYFYTTYYTTGLSDAAQYTDTLRSAAEGG